MKKYYIFGDQKLLKCDILLSTIVAAIYLFVIVAGTQAPIHQVLIVCLLIALFVFMFFVSHRLYAISLVSINEVGISSGQTQYRWKDIKDYKTYDYTPYTYRSIFGLKATYEVLCIGKFPKKIGGWMQWPKECILVSITPKNLQKIKEMNNSQSSAINELLSLYLRDDAANRKFDD